MSKHKSKPKLPRKSRTKRLPATLRETSGPGFEFEDLISACQLVKALSGERAPGIDSVVTQVQSQVSTLGWHIDDLLLTAQVASSVRQLAISAKGNFQVTAAGLPADFVTSAWEQWQDLQGPFNRSTDGLALVTRGTHPAFDPVWREVKSACSGADTVLAMSRIRSNKGQSRVFDSVRNPFNASDDETIELIRRLHVLPTDLQLAHSDQKNQAIAQCRHLIASGRDDEAENLWNELIEVAKGVRLQSGTITIPDLLSSLRGKFDLRHHPNFERDWETLSNITMDLKARVETALPSGYVLPRTAEKASLGAAVADNLITVVFGESGSGKSALVKDVLDGTYPLWKQVWFGPDELKIALSAANRSALPLFHELSLVLNATVKPQNVLVFDSAERIMPSEFVVIRQLLNAILPNDGDDIKGAWRIVIVTQSQSWSEDEYTVLGGRKAHIVGVDASNSNAVKLALQNSPTLSWLAAHDDTIAALANLRTLAWVLKAGAAFSSKTGELTSHTSIADRLWRYWTRGRADVQALMMRLAQREASFERSFALTDFDPSDGATFAQRPPELPLRLNERTNRIEFEHDLAADWARFQFLKQFWTDTSQWTAKAGNPLWLNALRMLGQFLLRQPVENVTAWDVAFKAAEVEENNLAGDILLDALCLDPDAERFLTERIDLLLNNREKNLTRLLLRFHHIATVPTSGGTGLGTEFGLYVEAHYRSIVFGRWIPVLRFLIKQRERLASLVSPALAKVIETWLTKAPRTLSNGNPMPYRLDLAEMALTMARTVQVEKGHGVTYLNNESVLYTAALAGMVELPTKIGAWALELAGRRELDFDVKRRIAEAQMQESTAHAERLKSDNQYRVMHERKQIMRSLGSLRERLPPWPLGAYRKVDGDFRSACIEANGIRFLIPAQPELAAEVLLALIIEDQPERDYSAERLEIDLGLSYPEGTYPTAFWKSPFYPFFQLAPETALTTLIALVNFCTERWVAETIKEREGAAPGVTLKFADGSGKTFPGWWQVFNWPQSNDSMRKGSLFCALDALERWLTLQIDEGKDITSYIQRIFWEGNSTALVSVLINVAKYQPELMKGSLVSLLTSPHLFYWDSIRVDKVDYNFIGWSWIQDGQKIFDLARTWTLAPHRKTKFLDVVFDLIVSDKDVARHIQALLPTWVLPEDPKEALEFKLLSAQLNWANYQTVTDPATGAETQRFVCPDELRVELQSRQTEAARPSAYLLAPIRCEQRLRVGQSLNDNDASYLFNLLKECEAAGEEVDEDTKSKCRFATACTLIALGDAWLFQNPEAKNYTLEVLRAGVADIASTGEGFQRSHMGNVRDELKFIAYAVMHQWLTDFNGVQEWETAVLRILTSGDTQAAGVVVDVAFANRAQLGVAWWRLMRAGLFWSGLKMLAPRHGDDNSTERAWSIWLARLRRFPLRGMNATPNELDFKRVLAGRERLDFLRQMRYYRSDNQTLRRKPERPKGSSLDAYFLEVLFHWLIKGDGTCDFALDARLALDIWDYEASRARARGKMESSGEYDLPSQNLGYDILLKLSALSIAAPAGEDRAIWEPVLSHGPAAHYALQHFIRGLFQRLENGDDPEAFERVWRAVVEYGLSADWSHPGLWFYGERLICYLLGFGKEYILSKLDAGAALRMKTLYQRWAANHLARDDECVTRFCHFLMTMFGAPLRLDGLCWLATMLNERDYSNRWHRKGTCDALVELVAMTLSSEAQALSHHVQARQALVEISAALAAMNITGALVLQERIKKLRWQ